MSNKIKYCILGLNLLFFLSSEKIILPMQFSSSFDMKQFVKDNAHQPYFQQLLESIQDPITSIIMHNRVLEYAKEYLSMPSFDKNVVKQLPEGCFKMAIRIWYCRKQNTIKYIDDVRISSFVSRLFNSAVAMKTGFLDLEGCVTGMPQFGNLLKFIIPLLEPLTQQKILLLRLCSNNLTNLPANIYCLDSLEKVYLQNNLLTTLPDEIKRLRKLNYIDISGNKFLNVPPNIAHIKEIVHGKILKTKTDNLAAKNKGSKKDLFKKRSFVCK